MYKKNKSSIKHGGVITYVSPTTVYTDSDTIINPYVSSIITTDPYTVPYNVPYTVPVAFVDPFIKPWVPSVTYPIIYNKYNDLNSDPVMRKKIVKYFRNLMLDKWLYNESRDILNYLKIKSDGNVDFLSNLSEYNPNTKDNSVDTEKKIKFIEKYVLSDNVILRLLSRYVHESTVSWVNLPRNKYYVRKLMEEKLYKMLKYAINENKH